MADGPVVEIGGVKIRLTLDDSDVVAGEDRVARSFERVSTKAIALGTTIGHLAADAIEGVIRAFDEWAKSSFDLVDQQSKLARALGGTVEGVQILTRTADLTGVSLDTLTRGLGTMNARLSEAAATGKGPAHDALVALKLDAEALANADVDERVKMISEQIDTLGISSAQTAQIVRDLGFRGTEFISFFQDAGATINDASREVYGFGIAISDIDAQNIEAANDAISKIGAIVQGIGNQIAVHLAPYLTAMATQLGDAAMQGRGFGDQVEGAIKTVIRVVGNLADAFYYVQGAMKTAQVIGLSAAAAIQNAWANVAVVISGTAKNIADSYNGIAGILHLPLMNPNVGADFAAGAIKGAHDLDDALSGAKKELEELENAPLPSDSIQKWFKDAELAAKGAAAAASWAQSNIFGIDNPQDAPEGSSLPALGSQGGSGGSGDSAAKQRQDAMQQRLDDLRDSLMTEQEAENDSYSQRLSDLYNFEQKGLVTSQEAAQMRERIEQQHMDNLAQIRRSGLQDIQDFTEMSYFDQAKTIFGQLQQITDGVKDNNDALFNINKAAAVANAVISAYEGISKTLATYPFPISVAMAAVQAGVAFAQVSNILSTTRNTKSVSPSLGGGTSAAATATSENFSQPTATPPGQTMYIRGIDPTMLYSGDAVARLVEGLKTYQRDGGNIVIEGR